MPRQELIIDNFAGGGGASTGIERALGRSPDVAINHDGEALAMHEANHRRTRHYQSDVFEIDPRVVTRMKPVGLAWFSPDCTHHSKARGCKPIRIEGKKSRSLANVVVDWAKLVKPRVIILENVEEFQDWGPVIQKRDARGRLVYDTDGSPLFVPCPKSKGKSFKAWVRALKRLGYAIEWKQLRACDYGAPTIRKRLFLIARCDGKPIVWPEATHGKPGTPEVIGGERLPWRAAAEIIDWSLPCPSIFLTPEEARPLKLKRPLAENTMKRIAAGIKRYVLDHPNPFIVVCNHGGDMFRGQSLADPFATVTASRDANGLVAPFVQTYYGPKSEGECRGVDCTDPLRTQGTENRFGVVAPVMTYAQHGGACRDASDPHHTVCASLKDQNSVIAPYFVPNLGERDGQEPRCRSVEQPLPTITAAETGAKIVAPFLASPAHSKTTGRAPNHWHLEEPLRTTTQSNDKCVIACTVGCGGRAGQSPPRGMESPLATVTSKADACVVAAVVDRQFGGSECGDVETPLGTVMASGQGKAALVAAFLAQHNTGSVGHDARSPVSTITQRGTQQQIVTAQAALLSHFRSHTNGNGGDLETPMNCLTAGGTHVAQVRAFLTKYYGEGGQWQDAREPVHTVPTRDRLGVVTVDGEPHEIVDIGMRMLTPRELFRAQGFPDSYKIDPVFAGRALPKSSQVRMCGNSVCPDMAEALVRANCWDMRERKRSREFQLELAGV